MAARTAQSPGQAIQLTGKLSGRPTQPTNRPTFWKSGTRFSALMSSGRGRSANMNSGLGDTSCSEWKNSSTARIFSCSSLWPKYGKDGETGVSGGRQQGEGEWAQGGAFFQSEELGRACSCAQKHGKHLLLLKLDARADKSEQVSSSPLVLLQLVNHLLPPVQLHLQLALLAGRHLCAIGRGCIWE